MEELPEMAMYSPFLFATEAPLDPIDLSLPFQIPDQYTHFNQASFQEVAPLQIHGGEKSIYSTPQPTQGNGSKKYESKMKEAKKDINRSKVVFRTKSNDEVLDDGYKWRKYGKKSIKNSPHPRNYYKCSSNGCGVKKRVERDPEDSSFTFTTYEGVHNHMSPGAIRSQNVTWPGRNLFLSS